jgi:hypothetical protein
MPSIKERLREGPPLSGYLNLIPSPVATQALAAAGADVVVIDQEHGPIGAESVHAMVAATAPVWLRAAARSRREWVPGPRHPAGADPHYEVRRPDCQPSCLLWRYPWRG